MLNTVKLGLPKNQSCTRFPFSFCCAPLFTLENAKVFDCLNVSHDEGKGRGGVALCPANQFGSAGQRKYRSVQAPARHINNALRYGILKCQL